MAWYSFCHPDLRRHFSVSRNTTSTSRARGIPQQTPWSSGQTAGLVQHPSLASSSSWGPTSYPTKASRRPLTTRLVSPCHLLAIFLAAQRISPYPPHHQEYQRSSAIPLRGRHSPRSSSSTRLPPSASPTAIPPDLLATVHLAVHGNDSSPTSHSHPTLKAPLLRARTHTHHRSADCREGAAGTTTGRRTTTSSFSRASSKITQRPERGTFTSRARATPEFMSPPSPGRSSPTTTPPQPRVA